MDAWDAENDRRRGEGDKEADKPDKHRQDRPQDSEDPASEAEESEDEEQSYRKDSMDNGGLAEALGRSSPCPTHGGRSRGRSTERP